MVMLIATFATQAQELKDTIETVKVTTKQDAAKDDRNQYSAGQQMQTIDTRYKNFYQTQSIANMLAQQTPVFIKSYGVNSMATLSFRGASAAQSSVLWNGVPIVNPALGVADISLLGSNLFDHIGLRYGSSAALYGSGNVGGALIVDNATADFKPSRHLSLNLGAGSYGRKDIAFNTAIQNSRWRFGLRGFYQTAKNNIPFTDNNDSLRTMSNAGLEAAGGILSADYNLAKNGDTREHVVYANIWYQQYYREIPAALFESSSVKKQNDASLRTLIGWRKEINKQISAYAKFSYNNEYLRYRDGVVLPDNKNQLFQYYQELGLNVHLNRSDSANVQHKFLLFAPLQFAGITGENLQEKHRQSRPAIAAAYSLSAFAERLKFNAAIRHEWLNGSATPTLPGAGLELAILNKELKNSTWSIAVRGNVQRTYRIPTLNELYYSPGGNENLKPEQGWTQDAGYSINWNLYQNNGEQRTRKILFHHELSFFNRNIKDWIYWLGGAIWTPHNIAQVHSRGIETDNKLEVSFSTIKVITSLRSAYVLSTSQASYIPGDNSLGKQIPYTPRYNGQLNAGLEWKGLFINYNHTYTGYRFVTIDESQYMQPYSVGNIQLLYSFTINDYLIRAAAQVQNVWDKAYNVVWERPMPGRNVLFTLAVGIGNL